MATTLFLIFLMIQMIVINFSLFPISSSFFFESIFLFILVFLFMCMVFLKCLATVSCPVTFMKEAIKMFQFVAFMGSLSTSRKKGGTPPKMFISHLSIPLEKKCSELMPEG